MNKIIYITIGALAIAVIALAIGFSTKTPVVNVNPELKVSQEQLGAVSGPSVDFPSFTVNGVETFYYTSALRTSTSTIASFLTPSATTTLVFASLNSTKELISAMEFEIGKSTASSNGTANNTATTTSLGLYVAASGSTFTMLASTTPDASDTTANVNRAWVFPPHSRLNFKVSSTSPAQLVGSAKAIFVKN